MGIRLSSLRNSDSSVLPWAPPRAERSARARAVGRRAPRPRGPSARGDPPRDSRAKGSPRPMPGGAQPPRPSAARCVAARLGVEATRRVRWPREARPPGIRDEVCHREARHRGHRTGVTPPRGSTSRARTARSAPARLDVEVTAREIRPCEARRQGDAPGDLPPRSSMARSRADTCRHRGLDVEDQRAVRPMCGLAIEDRRAVRPISGVRGRGSVEGRQRRSTRHRGGAPRPDIGERGRRADALSGS